MDVWRIIHHRTYAENDAESSSTERDPDGVGDIDIQTYEASYKILLEEGRAGLGATLGSHSLHTGSVGTSPFLPTIAHVPVLANARGDRIVLIYQDGIPQSILHRNFGEESHMSGPQTAAPTPPNPEHPDNPFDQNTFARRGSFIYFPEHLNINHDRPMGSKSGAMEHEPWREMAREPEEVFANTTTLAQFPSPSATLMKPTRAKKVAKMKTPPSRMLRRLFTVSTSLIGAATMTAVFPRPLGKVGNVMRFISADSPTDSKICKLCYKSFKQDSDLTRHWLQAHAYKDLSIALTYPNANHNKLIINSTSRRDILLAAVYTCPWDACLDLSQVGVFITKDSLYTHTKGHRKRLEKLGQDSGRNVAAELQQLRERFKTYVNKDPFWQKTDCELAHFTHRDAKLVWMLNQKYGKTIESKFRVAQSVGQLALGVRLICSISGPAVGPDVKDPIAFFIRLILFLHRRIRNLQKWLTDIWGLQTAESLLRIRHLHCLHATIVGSPARAHFFTLSTSTTNNNHQVYISEKFAII
ncbi:hypothetical protein BU17DRAFT_67415 [Hysterangium stoloniferum]|nr:hypothetical protein BU17DRAFT_67415 [Hysterangium stoloniferum]